MSNLMSETWWWPYVMILVAVLLLALVSHGAILWRDGWPLPWETLPGL